MNVTTILIQSISLVRFVVSLYKLQYTNYCPLLVWRVVASHAGTEHMRVLILTFFFCFQLHHNESQHGRWSYQCNMFDAMLDPSFCLRLLLGN